MITFAACGCGWFIGCWLFGKRSNRFQNFVFAACFGCLWAYLNFGNK